MKILWWCGVSLLLFVSTLALAQQDAACRTTPGVNLAYADHRLAAGDYSAALEVIPPEQLLPGLDWLVYSDQNSSFLFFSHPPQWQPSTLSGVVAGQSGVRLDAPDGGATFETFTQLPDLFSPRPDVSLEDIASYAFSRVLGNQQYQVICADYSLSPTFASAGFSGLFAAASSASQVAVVMVTSSGFSGQQLLQYTVYGGPSADFENLVRYVFSPVMNSFPKGGSGSCTCEAGEPDRDGDGLCDTCDTYPDDASRQ